MTMCQNVHKYADEGVFRQLGGIRRGEVLSHGRGDVDAV